MRFVAIFDDQPAMMAVRAERGERHLAYLREHADQILIAGGLRIDAGEDFCGGLWVMEVVSREAAVALVENDPYFEPLHRRYQLRLWGKVFDDPVTL